LTKLRWDPQHHVGTLLRHGHDSHLAELKPATGSSATARRSAARLETASTPATAA
jgi:hypothetical protein